MEQSFPDSSAEAESLLLDALASNGQFDSGDLARLCTARPELAAELRVLYASFEDGRGLVGALNPSAELTAASAASAAPSEPEFAAELEPRYRIVREIARGGMSIILEVWDARLRRTLAMKRLPPIDPGARRGPIERERRRARLFNEAQVLAQLAHPGIVPMYDAARDQHDEPYFTMLLVRGDDLSEIFRRSWEGRDGWSQSRVVGVLQRVCESVAYAHERGVIHRDLKPANVMVGAFGETYVLDWGLARADGGPASSSLPVEHVGESSSSREELALRPNSSHSMVHTDRADVRHASDSSPLLTQEGDVVGTPAYMAPEQAAGNLREVTAAADVYSVGAMLYELLARHAPYCEKHSDRSQHEVLREVRRSTPAALRYLARSAPDELIAISERAMAREPARRYASMRALADDLRAFLENRVVSAHRTGPIVELKKWVARNRWAAAAIGTFVAASITIAIVQTLLKNEIEVARRATEARAEELRHEDYFNKIALAGTASQQGDTQRHRALLGSCPADLRGFEWRYLQRQADTSDRLLQVASAPAYVQFTPDGRSLVTISTPSWMESQLELWDPDHGCREREIKLGAARDQLYVYQLSFSSNGAWAAAMRSDWEVFLWDTRTWSPRPSLRLLPPVNNWPSVVFAPVGSMLCVSGGGPVQLWDVERHELVGVLDSGQQPGGACWSPDGARLYVGSWDGTISVWDVATRSLVATLRTHQDRVTGLQASPDGRWLISGGWEKRVLVWDARTLTVAHDTGESGYAGGMFAWAPDSSYVAIGVGSVVRLMAAGTWVECGRLVGHALNVNSVSIDPGGKRIATASVDGTARIWNLDRADRWTYHGDAGNEPAPPSFSADGAWLLVSWFKAGVLEMWSAAERRVVHTWHFGRRIGPASLARGGAHVAFFDLEHSTVQILDPPDVAVRGEIRPPIAAEGDHDPRTIVFEPDGTRFCIVGKDGVLTVADARSLEVVWTVAANPGPKVWPGRLRNAAWSPDGSRIVALTLDGRVQVWDAARGVLVREGRGRAESYVGATFAPDGELFYLTSPAPPGSRECWSASTLTSKWSVESQGFASICRTADGSRVVTLGANATLDFQDAATGRLILSIPTGGYMWSAICVSPVEELVVTLSNRGVRFWDTRPWAKAAIGPEWTAEMSRASANPERR